MNARQMRQLARAALRADTDEVQVMIDALRQIAGKDEPPCGANVDHRATGLLVCQLPHGHHGDHNTARDGSGDAFVMMYPFKAVGG